MTVEDDLRSYKTLVEARELIESQIDEVQDRLIDHAAKALDVSADSLTVTFEWDCEDPRNEIKTCVYGDDEECLFCGEPEERK